MMSVFDWLDLADLMHMAEVNPPSQMMISKYYLLPQYKLNSSEITITLGKDTHMAHTTHGRFANGPDRLLFVLRTYGHIFRHLKVHVYQNGPISVAKLSKHINKYCSEATQEIVIHPTFNQWNFTFNNATTVTMYWSMLQIKANQSTQWSDSFPKMQALAILNALSLTAINLHFPHLTRFTLRTKIDISDVADLRDFIRLNRQLRSLEIPLPKNNALLMHINEMLPNLESLTLSKACATNIGPNDIVRFENVRHFSWAVPTFASFGGWDIQLPSRFSTIAFDRLETFTLDTEIPAAVTNHIPLVVRNKALQLVNIAKCEVRYEDLMEIVRSLPVLRVLTIGWEQKSTLPALSQLLMNSPRLEAVTIHIIDEFQLNARVVLDYIPATWRMNGENFVDGQSVLSVQRIE